MAGFLGQETVLIDVNHGPGAIAESLAQSVQAPRLRSRRVHRRRRRRARAGDEAGLTSPLCDAVMLAAALKLGRAGHPVLAGVFGIGCDAELTPAEVLGHLAEVAAQGGLCGARGLTAPVANGSRARSRQCLPRPAPRQSVPSAARAEPPRSGVEADPWSSLRPLRRRSISTSRSRWTRRTARPRGRGRREPGAGQPGAQRARGAHRARPRARGRGRRAGALNP